VLSESRSGLRKHFGYISSADKQGAGSREPRMIAHDLLEGWSETVETDYHIMSKSFTASYVDDYIRHIERVHTEHRKN
jgi:hypothetical protein